MPARDLPWRIEETCWNAFPALKQVLAGDFVLRFARGVSRRANSANPLHAAPAGIDEVVTVAERLYRAQRQAAIFRVPTIVDPGLDRNLAGRGYTAEGETCVIYAPIAEVAAASDPEIELLATPELEWLDAMSSLQGHSGEQRAIYARIVGAIAIPARFALLRMDGQAAALAYGAMHDRLLCYESVITHSAYRRQGLAWRVISALAGWARDGGAAGACLQVEAGNAPARALYDRFGLRTELYRYHYRREPAAP